MNLLWMLGQSVLNGLTMGGIYALLAVGLTVIFGVMKVVNFAQGEYLTIGMYITLVLYQMTGYDPYVLLIPTVVIAYIVGMLSFKVVVRPLLGQPGSNFIVATMGLAFVIQSVLQIIFSSDFQSVPSVVKNKSLIFGEFALAWPRVIACGCMFLFVFLVDFFLKKTDLGRAMRATSENTTVAQSLGINTVKIFGFAFALGTTFAAVTGLLLSPIYFIYPTVGSNFKSVAMAIIVMGGLGNIKGAVIAGMIAGVLEALVATFVGNDLSSVTTYVLLILILAVKPAGILGKGARVA